jgi:hypothetical protein
LLVISAAIFLTIVTEILKQVNAAKKAVKVIDRDARLSLETAIKRPDMTQELLNPAERAAERRRGSNIESN